MRTSSRTGRRSTPSAIAEDEPRQRRRLHAWIDGREAAADVEPVHHHAGLADQTANLGQRIDVGVGRHRLRADVEGHAKLRRDLARLDQQPRCLLTRGAELALERNAAVDGRHGDAHEQHEVAGAHAVHHRLVGDLLQLILGIEREAPDAVHVVGLADRLARLHRVHEMQMRARDRRRVLELHRGSHVEMTDAGAVERPDQEDRAISLVGVGDVARKVIQEPARPSAQPHAGGRREQGARAYGQ